MKNHATGIHGHISWVYTQNIDLTSNFYSEILGLECDRDQGKARIFRTADSAWIGVCEAFADRVVAPEGGMISIVIDDVDGWYRRLVDKGLVISRAPHRLEQFGITTFFVRDPNGYVIEFQQFDD